MKDDDDRGYRPRWLWFAPFLGRAPALTRRQWRVLGLVSIVSLFEQYDVYLLSLNLKQIQADLGIPESELGLLGGLVRAGALPAILVTLNADRIGRRRLLLYTILGYTLLTGATALAPNATIFIACQFLARIFAAAETAVSVVVIAEEFDPQHRGWGIGALGALQALGAGLAAFVFGFVDVLPYGWRSLYAVGLAPLLIVAYLRRTLHETPRFAALARTRSEKTSFVAPIIELVRRHPARVAAIVIAVLSIEIVMGPALFFAPKFLQDVRGWTPGQVGLLNVMGGLFAIVGNAAAGQLSDRYGRRPITAVFTIAFLLVTVCFYEVAVLPAAVLWILLIFTMMGSQVTLLAYGAEMFPTSVRSTASGVRELSRAAGAVAGLGLVSLLFVPLGSNWLAIVALCAVGALAPLCVLLMFPETAGRELEDIGPG